MRMTLADDAQAAKMVASGLSFRQAAEALGTTDKTVKAAVERHKTRKKRKGKEVPLRETLLTLDAKAIKKVREGLDKREVLILNVRLTAQRPWTLQELATSLQVSRQRAYQLEEALLERLADAV